MNKFVKIQVAEQFATHPTCQHVETFFNNFFPSHYKRKNNSPFSEAKATLNIGHKKKYFIKH